MSRTMSVADIFTLCTLYVIADILPAHISFGSYGRLMFSLLHSSGLPWDRDYVRLAANTIDRVGQLSRVSIGSGAA